MVGEPGFSLRPAGPDDREFLARVYASTRAEEMALVAWDGAQKAAFVESQFAAQDRHYREHFADASFDVLVVGGEPVGRLTVARWPAEIRIVDVALLAEFRGRGTGTAVLRSLLAEGEASGRPVTIHVEKYNRALALYARLGFAPAADRGAHLFMRWLPPSPPAQVNTAS